jgi:hypothetical protein
MSSRNDDEIIDVASGEYLAFVAPLKPSAFRGDLCFGPSQSQNITFVNPREWIGNWQSVEPERALQEIARLYLQAYGPTTSEDFARWWWGGGGRVPAKKLFHSIERDPVGAFDGAGPLLVRRSSMIEPASSL